MPRIGSCIVNCNPAFALDASEEDIQKNPQVLHYTDLLWPRTQSDLHCLHFESMEVQRHRLKVGVVRNHTKDVQIILEQVRSQRLNDVQLFGDVQLGASVAAEGFVQSQDDRSVGFVLEVVVFATFDGFQEDVVCTGDAEWWSGEHEGRR